MTPEKQIEDMYNDLIEIFDEEYNKRFLITAQNTAEKLTAKGYRLATDVAREIFAEIEHTAKSALILLKFERDEDIRTIKSECYEDLLGYIAELKKKWEAEENDNT